MKFKKMTSVIISLMLVLSSTGFVIAEDDITTKEIANSSQESDEIQNDEKTTIIDAQPSVENIQVENLEVNATDESEDEKIMLMADTSVTYNATGGKIYFDSSSGTITSADSTVTVVEIPSEINGIAVKAIGNNAFKDCTVLQSITFPTSLNSIGNYAFYNTAITELTIPAMEDGNFSIGYEAFADCLKLSKVTVNGNFAGNSNISAISEKYVKNNVRGAFNNCESLETVIFDNGTTKIPKYAFTNCTNLKNIQIPNSINTIEEAAFANCTSLSDIDSIIGNGVTTINKYAFYNCNPEEITLPDALVSTGEYAFASSRNLKKVTVDSDYTGSYTFDSCTSLSNVVLSDNVKKIGNYAFYNCSAIKTLNLPSDLLTIGNYAFANCSLLNSISFPDTLESIGNYAFENVGITDLTIPEMNNGNFSIGYEAFADCLKLSKVTVNGNFAGNSNISAISEEYVKNNVRGAFNNCTLLKTVIFGDSVTKVPKYSFTNCPLLSDVEISDSISKIETAAFANCTGLTDINSIIGNSVSEIESYAFYNTNATDLTIPEGIIKIGGYAFSSSSNLKKVTINADYNGSYTFTDCTALKDVVINDDVTIGAYSFSGCSSLTNLTLSDSVAQINDYAFNNCSVLKTVELPNEMKSIGNYAFYNTGITNLTIPDMDNNSFSIGYGAFADCAKLSKVTINGNFTGDSNISASSETNVKNYVRGAFNNCTVLKTVIFGDNVTKIPKYSFTNCPALTTVQVTDSINTIESCAFANCTYLANVNSIINQGVTNIGSYAFYNTKVADITIPESVVSIGDYGFANCTYLKKATINGKCVGSYTFDSCTSLKTVEINGDKAIGNYAFNGCSSLSNLTLSDTVESINDYSFANCSALKTVSIPNTVTSIGTSAFANCSALKSVTFPNALSSIGNYAFKNTGFSEITVPSSADTNYSIGYEAFADCVNLKKITVNGDFIGNTYYSANNEYQVKNLVKGAFNNCSALKEVVFSDNVAKVAKYSFTNCTALKTVYIPKSVVLVEICAFANDTGITDVYYDGSESDWGGISFGTYNDNLVNATVHYESEMPTTTETSTETTTESTTENTTKDNETETSTQDTTNSSITNIVKVSSPTAACGKNVTVDVDLTDCDGMAGYEMVMSFDSDVLTPISYSSSSSSFTTTSNMADKNIDVSTLKELKFIGDSLDDIKSTRLVSVTFKVNENAIGTTNVNVSFTAATNSKFDDINLNVTNGTITVNDFTYGDINGDGNINIKDVVLLRQYLAGWSTVALTDAQKKAANVYADSTVNVKDLVKLRQYVAGWSDVILG